MVRPIDQATLDAIGGQGLLRSTAQFANTMQNFAQNRAQQEEQQQAQQLRAMQMQQLDYDMKASIGEDILRERAYSMEPPKDGATTQDWLKYAKLQEAGGYTNSAKSAYEYAEALSTGADSLPEGFKNYPEVAKLTVLMRKALKANDLTTAKDYRDRIDKLKNEKPPAAKEPKIESSTTSAKNVASTLATAGITIEGAEAQALGDLSRSLTIQAKEHFNMTQSEVNDEITRAYAELKEERGIGTFEWDDLNPFTPAPEAITKEDVEQRVIQNVINTGTAVPKTVLPTPEQKEDDLVNKYS